MSSIGSNDGPVPPPPPPDIQCNSKFSKKIQDGRPSITPLIDDDFFKLIEELCYQYLEVLCPCSPSESKFTNIFSMYTHCDSVLQSGPTCGLVALIMSLKIVKPNFEFDIQTVLNLGKSFGYTKFGEMFSVQNMHRLIENGLKVKAQLKYDLEQSMNSVVEHLCRGLPVLVPYDADANYEPCLKEGERAHWAVICGFCLVVTQPDTNQSIDSARLELKRTIQLNGDKTLLLINPKLKCPQTTFEYIKSLLSSEKLFVYAKQGKSRRVQIWNYHQLIKSNQNLNKVSSKILNDPERVKMIYPKNGDLSKSLSNQFILIFNR